MREMNRERNHAKRLPRRPVKLASRQQMEMNMKDRLSGTGIIVVHDSETMIGHAKVTSQLRGNLKDVPDQEIVIRTQIK